MVVAIEVTHKRGSLTCISYSPSITSKLHPHLQTHFSLPPHFTLISSTFAPIISHSPHYLHTHPLIASTPTPIISTLYPIISKLIPHYLHTQPHLYPYLAPLSPHSPHYFHIHPIISILPISPHSPPLSPFTPLFPHSSPIIFSPHKVLELPNSTA